MNRVKVLLLTNESVSEDEIVDRFDETQFDVTHANLGEAEAVAQEIGAEIAVIAVAGKQGWDDGLNACRNLRDAYYERVLEVLFVADEEGLISQAIDAGANDFLPIPIEERELGSRLRAALIRLQSQARLLEERNFFRSAAKQEEELSSRILDQHMVLKQAFQNIEAINRELEEANKRLEQVARYDTLSGLLNRVSLLTAMDVEIERSVRSKTALSGIMMDIDHFKNINDSYGHLYGDHVISEIGRRLLKSLRKYDHAGRYGGEEFFIVLPNTTIEQAYVIAERFRRELQSQPIMHSGAELAVTASFGIAQFQVGETRVMWLGRADKLMYHAKQSGRNRVVAS